MDSRKGAKNGLSAERQVPVVIQWRAVRFDESFHDYIMVENKVILELNSVERITNAHQKQVLTYLNRHETWLPAPF